MRNFEPKVKTKKIVKSQINKTISLIFFSTLVLLILSSCTKKGYSTQESIAKEVLEEGKRYTLFQFQE